MDSLDCIDPMCTLCGRDPERPLAGLDMSKAWPIHLGSSIRAFVRRAEVQELRFALLGSAHNWKAAWRPEDDDRRQMHWRVMLDCVDRLAALALSGADGGHNADR